MEITPEQWTELHEKLASMDARLTAQEGQVALHHQKLITGNGYPPVPEQVRAQGVRIDGMDAKLDEVKGMIKTLVDNAATKQAQSEDRRWDMAKIVITITLTQIAINYIVPMFLKP